MGKVTGRVLGIILMAFFLFFGPSCKQVKKEIEVTPEEARVSKEAQRELPTAPEELYPKLIDVRQGGEKIVEALDDVISRRFKGEDVQVPPETVKEVERQLDEKIPVGNKVLLVYKLSRAGISPSFELISKLNSKARAETELKEELAFSLGVINREKLHEYFSKKPEELSEKELAEMRELAENELFFFEKAWDKRHSEYLYAYGALGAYFDLERAKLGGRIDKKKIISGQDFAKLKELLNPTGENVTDICLASPPWLFYVQMWQVFPPAIYKEAEAWGPERTSVSQELNLMMESFLEKKDYELAIKTLQTVRLVATASPVTIENLMYSIDMMRDFGDVVVRHLRMDGYGKRAREYRKMILDNYASWKEQGKKALEEKKKLILEDLPLKAMGVERELEMKILPKLAQALDVYEDPLKVLNREQLEKAQKANK